ncbi:MAG: hypothetical protein JW807_02395 [Spirochaetes bacterium]|nr:hypothetical protein [Spirochaetota bacterium]
MKTYSTIETRTAKLGAVLCALSLLLPACGGKSDSGLLKALFLGGSGDKSGSTLIPAATGGVVQLNDEVKLTVAPEALAEDLTISIERTSSVPAGEADGLSPFGQAYRFLPQGTGFDLGEPAVLEMYYDAAELARLGLSPQTIQICYYDEELKCYVPVNCFVDTVQHKVTALIEHFTIYLPMAMALLPTNNEPYVGLLAPWPTTIRAGAPIYVRATVTDYDGAIAGATLRYCKLHGAGAGVWYEVRMAKETGSTDGFQTYGYLLPASFLTDADLGDGNDLEYTVQATDNLGAVRTSGVRRYNVTRTYQPGSLFINPPAVDIAAGFERFMLARGVDSNDRTFSLVPETFVMAGGSGVLENRFSLGILLSATTPTPAGTPDQLTIGFDGESASASISVYAGELESIEILDTSGISIPGDLFLSEGTSYAFDVVGRDGYGNTIPVIPVWSADASIGAMDPDGILDTTGCLGPGVVTASLGYFTDTQNVYVQSRAKEITDFSINGVAGQIAYPFITVTLPWGTDVTGLVAAFSITGTGITVDGDVQESGVTANDFTDPVVYRVTAEDGSSQDYTVQVRMLSPYKDITAFSISGANVTIIGTNITAYLPNGTDATSLVASFTTTGQSVTVGGVVQESGVTANDFTEAVVYTVHAEDGSTKDYTVTVSLVADIQGLVSHFAGTVGGAGKSDGIGSDARFSFPTDVTTDGVDLYVADSRNHTIRRIAIATGEVTTFAGLAENSGSSDGIGSDARFKTPSGIATDGVNLFVADTGNHTIRRIAIATGEVTTLAGMALHASSADGTGAEARFNTPHGITVNDGNLYVADMYNHTIRKIVIATGEVTTLAGQAGTSGYGDGIGTAAKFNTPVGITTNGVYLYVTDSMNYVIRMIDIATARVYSMAGYYNEPGTTDGTGATARFNVTRGITCDGVNLYVAEYNAHSIRKIEIASSSVTTIAGIPTAWGYTDGIGSAARFNCPWGIATDGANLYVAEYFSHKIRKIEIATSSVTSLAGMASEHGSTDDTGTAARFYHPSGITSDGSNLYVADTENQTIRKIVAATSEVTTFAGLAGNGGYTDGIGSAARFTNPHGITTDGTNLYVTDYQNSTIRKIVIATREVSTLAGLARECGSADGTGSEARFYTPCGITTTGGNLYVTDVYMHTIRKIVIASGEVSTLAGLAGTYGSADGTGSAARFRSPIGITTDGANLYVADSSNYTIRKIVIATGEVTTLAGSASISGYFNGIGSAARFSTPTGITTDGVYLFVTELINATVRKIVIATGEVTTLAGNPGIFGSKDGYGSEASFSLSYDIFHDGTRLYVADSNNNCIRVIE